MSTVLDTELPKPPVEKAGLDIRALLEEHAGRNYELHAAHVNPANVRTLKTIGFDRCYVRAEGPYLWDVQGNQYLDMLSGYGVFGLGRNHPEVRRVLTEFLDLNYPSLVKMEAPLLSGLLAGELKKRMPNQLDMVFFTNSGAEGMETALKYARCATGKSAATMLDQLRTRLNNDAATELANAAREQAMVTRLRLERMLTA